MKSTVQSSSRKSVEEANRFSRRMWLQSSAAAGLFLLPLTPLAAQDPGLQGAVRRMSSMTGTDLPGSREAPVTTLVGIILDYSKPLRLIDLGELEPATQFSVR